MAKTYRELTTEQMQHFLDNGYVVIEQAFTREAAEQYTSLAWDRLGYKADDPSTWEQEIIHMPALNRFPIKDFAPRAWNAMCDLVGGEERIDPERATWADTFILNLKRGAGEPYREASATSGGWHNDGDFFRHFLDSPEQGLLTIICWSDILPRSGGTFIATDSVPLVARHLAQHPEGIRPGPDSPISTGSHLISECQEFMEITGNTGDVVLLHPFILHASSQNPSGRPRFITNPTVFLNEPMNFNRENLDDHSLVEQAILNALGVERFDFQPTHPREKIEPERVRRQKAMLEAEKARLGMEQ